MLKALQAQALPLEEGSPLVLMVSGGSDSTALLVRCARGEVDLLDGRGPGRLAVGRLHVLHVNHCLRGQEADRDEAFVRGLCAALGVSFEARRVDVPALMADGGNFEDAAREARYQEAWRLACDLCEAAGLAPGHARILVAHTADDRAETFLMRAMTGAGTTGLAGMRRMRGIVARPLLDETREDLRAYLRREGVGWCEDSTNDEDGALRSYVRHHVTPPMRERAPRFAGALGRALDAMTLEDDLLERLAREVLQEALMPARPGTAVLDAGVLATADPALAPRCMRLALRGLLGEDAARAARLEARHLEALVGMAREGRGSACLPGGVEARLERGALVLSGPARKDPPPDAALPVPGEAAWGGVLVRAEEVEVGREGPAAAAQARSGELARAGLVEGRDFVIVDARVCRDGLAVGSPRPGERMSPFGMRGTKLLSDLLPQAGVALHDRPWVPVFRRVAGHATEGACVWVGGIRLDQRAAWNSQTTSLVQLSVIHLP